MKIYIAGKITGMSKLNYTLKFLAAQYDLELQGHTAYNPARLGEAFEKLEYEDYMEIDRVLIRAADAIYLLNNWQDSKGAMQELQYAKELGKKVMYQEVL